MSTNSFQRSGDPVQVGWSIGRAPLSVRGIRFATGEGGNAPAGENGQSTGGQPAGGENPSAPNPAQLAAFYAAQNGGQASPTPQPPAPQTPAQVQHLQGFTPAQMQKAMTDAEAAQKAAKDAQEALAAAQKERDDALAQVAEHTRTNAVRAAATAAEKAGNADLLLDSAKFQAAIKDVDLTDATALGAAVTQFVTENPAYAAAPVTPLPNTSGGTPAGGSTDKPKTLEGAIAARLGG